MKEATARIKINKLLEAAGWRFFPESGRPANIKLEHTTTLTPDHLDCLGEDFEKTSKGFIDFLLLNEKGFPFIVLKAKSEDKNPLVGKEQARKYARAQNCRFVILSNGNLHYFWDLERGNPYILTAFPTPESVGSYEQVEPNPSRLVEEPVGQDYIVLTQRPNYKSEAAWINEAERPGFVDANRLRFLREYQLEAVQAVQKAVREGKDRFLFEIATGTGKTLDDAGKLSLEAIGRFVEASEEIRFEAEDRQQLYGWVERVLVGQQYAEQGKVARGLVRRYIVKMTGLSRAQVTRLIARYTASGRVQVTVYRRRRFSQLYTRADIELLASVDEAHETLSGPATRRILEREHLLYKRPEYARLAAISVAHLYNLRHHQRYRERLLNYARTRPAAVSISERRKPRPQGQPGFLRLDTVHQGDRPEGGEKGVYHINAVDEVTQWEVAGSTPRISKAYLEPVLEHMLRQFPFRIQGFHTDNGSEFINRMVARQLEKLRIEQTKSRPRQSGDNGLVETKNGAVIRKHIGYGYIDAKHADAINGFYREYLNPYLNYHRPCAQADVKIDEKGRKRIRYKRYQTPLETLSLLDKPAQYLRDGLSMNALERVAAAISDTDAARWMQQAKAKLFERLRLTAYG